MEQIVFKPSTVNFIRDLTPTVNINQKSGIVIINKSACDVAGIMPGSQVQFVHNVREAGDVYLEIVNEEGFLVRKNKRITHGVKFNHTPLTRTVLKALECREQSLKLQMEDTPLETEDRKLWPLKKKEAA